MALLRNESGITPTDSPEEPFWLKFSPERVDVTSRVAAKGAGEQTRSVAFEYLANGMVAAAEREPDALGGQPAEQSLYYRTDYVRGPTFGNVESVVAQADAGVRTTTFEYDDRGLLPVAVENDLQHRTELQFDDRNGQLLTSRDPNGVLTQHAYDGFGRLRTTVTPTAVEATEYVPPDNVWCPQSPQGVFCIVQASFDVGEVGPNPNYAENGYYASVLDGMGQLVADATFGLDGGGLERVERAYAYDWRGRLLSSELPHLRGDTSQGANVYEYDALDRLSRATTADGRVLEMQHFSRASVQPAHAALFATDSAAYATVTTQFDGSRSAFVTDVFARTVRSGQVAGSGPLSAGAVTEFSYGYFGLLDRVEAPDDLVTEYTYDLVGRQVAVDDTAAGLRRVLAHTGFDEPVETVDGIGQRRCLAFDSLGRLRRVSEGGPNGCDTPGVTLAQWEYDERTNGCGPATPNCSSERLLGKLVEMERIADAAQPDVHTRTWFHYETDPNLPGRLIATELEPIGAVDPLVTQYAYDGARLAQVVYPSVASAAPLVLGYFYDGHGHLREIQDPQGKSYWTALTADQGIRIQTERFGNGVEATYDYFSLAGPSPACPSGGACLPGTLRRSSWAVPGSAALGAIEYDYNPMGDVSERRTVPAFGGVGELRETFGYDEFQRLESHTKHELLPSGNVTSTHSYSYSLGGDMEAVHVDGVLTDSYAYSNGRLSTFNGLTMSHDGNGNLTSRPSHTRPTAAFDYNELDLPRQITSGGESTVLEYDGMGARVAKRGPAQTTLYAGQIYECEGQSPVLPDDPVVCESERFNIYVGSRLVAQVSRDLGVPAETHYVHADSLGSTTIITNDAGDVEERRYFDPFGRTETDFGALSLNRGFTGHEHDPDLALINMRGRMYDPSLRRFTTPDPFVGEPLNSQGWNAYAYVMNNPVNLVDPSGFFSREYEMPSRDLGPTEETSGTGTEREIGGPETETGGGGDQPGGGAPNTGAPQESGSLTGGADPTSTGPGTPPSPDPRGGGSQGGGPTGSSGERGGGDGGTMRPHVFTSPQGGGPSSTMGPSPASAGPGSYPGGGQGSSAPNPGGAGATNAPTQTNQQGKPDPTNQLGNPAAAAIGGAAAWCAASGACVAAVQAAIVGVAIAIGIEIVGNVPDADDGGAGDDAKAPGVPTAQDGFVPPKNWDGGTVRNPNGAGRGFPDRKGRIWVPTGPGGTAHGGPHWDVQLPNGGHINVYPGGKVR